MTENTTYSRKEIEIADYIFAQPTQKREDVLAYFCAKFRKSRRSVETYYAKAKEYNQTRTLRIQKEKDKEIINSEKESFKRDILTREESLEILSKIAIGHSRKVGDKILSPSDADRTRAISTIAEFQGWNAPVKNDLTMSGKRINEITIKYDRQDDDD